MKKTIEIHKRWKDDPSKGEVFTPEELVKEMLDKIPTSVWENPASTFLDPCMGKGTFLIDILRRLTTIYGYSVEDAMSRIYGYDVRVKYMNYLKRGGFKNIFHKDFLNENIDMKFDVVVGNPPYQDGSKVNARAEKLWPKFIQKSTDLLDDNGVLVYVTPLSWLSGTGNIKKGSYGVYDLFRENNLKYVKTGIKFDGQGVDAGIFIMEKNNNYQSTKFDVNNESFTISIKDFDFLPTDMNKVKISIMEKTLFNTQNYDTLPATGVQKTRNLGVDEITETHNVMTYVRGGNNYNLEYAYFTQDYHANYTNIKKVVVPISGAEKFMPFVDFNNTPICCNSYVLKLENDSVYEYVNNFFNSKMVKFLIQELRSSGFVQVKVVKNLPKVEFNRDWTDNDIYDYFNLTEYEKEYIESRVG